MSQIQEQNKAIDLLPPPVFPEGYLPAPTAQPTEQHEDQADAQFAGSIEEGRQKAARLRAEEVYKEAAEQGLGERPDTQR